MKKQMELIDAIRYLKREARRLNLKIDTITLPSSWFPMENDGPFHLEGNNISILGINISNDFNQFNLADIK